MKEERIEFEIQGRWVDGNTADLRSGKERRCGSDRRINGDRRIVDRRKPVHVAEQRHEAA